MEQFALLQQAEWEAKRRHQHDRGTLINMYDTVSKQMVEVQQQLAGVLSSRNSTEQLLRQVLGAVEDLQAAQQRVDSRTAEAVQHAKAAAVSAAAAAQQQAALADEIKVRGHALS